MITAVRTLEEDTPFEDTYACTEG